MKTIFSVFFLVILAVGCEPSNQRERAMVRQVEILVNRNENRIETVAGTFNQISILHGRMSNVFVHNLVNSASRDSLR